MNSAPRDLIIHVVQDMKNTPSSPKKTVLGGGLFNISHKTDQPNEKGKNL